MLVHEIYEYFDSQKQPTSQNPTLKYNAFYHLGTSYFCKGSLVHGALYLVESSHIISLPF